MTLPRYHNFILDRDREFKALDAIVEELRAMTPEESKQSLIDAGILTKSGRRLTRPYRKLYEEDMAIIEAENARRPKCECGRPLPGVVPPPAPAFDAAQVARASGRKRKATSHKRGAKAASSRRSTAARHKRRP